MGYKHGKYYRGTGMFGNMANAFYAVSRRYRTPTQTAKRQRTCKSGSVRTHEVKHSPGIRRKSRLSNYSPMLSITKRKTKVSVEAVHGQMCRKTYLIGRYIRGKNSRGKWTVYVQRNIPLTDSTSSEGQQNAFWIGSFATSTQLVQDTGSPDLRFQYYQALCNFNPYQNNSGGDVYSPVSIPSDDRFYVDYVTVELMVVNNSTVPVELRLMMLKCKKNTPVQPITCWFNALQSQALGYANAVQPNPTGSIAAASGAPVTNTIGQTPHQCPNFLKEYSICKDSVFDLAPNANLMVRYHIGIGKLVDRRYISDIVAGFGVAGMTYSLIGIMRGGLITDTVGTHTASIAGVSLGMVMNAKYVCHNAGTNRLQTQYLEIPQFITGSSTANQKQINVVDVLSSLATNN